MVLIVERKCPIGTTLDTMQALFLGK